MKKVLPFVLCLFAFFAPIRNVGAAFGGSQSRETTANRPERIRELVAAAQSDEGAIPLRIRKTPDQYVRFIGVPRSGRITVRTKGLRTPAASARAFIHQWRDLFSEESPVVGYTHMRSVSKGKRTYVRLQQTYADIPVFAGEIAVQLNDNCDVECCVTDMMRKFESLESDAEALKPDISATDASDMAIVALQEEYDSLVFEATAPMLMIYDPSIVGLRGLPKLVWKTEIRSLGQSVVARVTLINAHNGEVVFQYPTVYDALGREIRDASNQAGQISTIARTEGDPPSGITDVDLAYDFLGDTYDFYATHHSRDGIDDSGSTLVAVVRYCPSVNDCPMSNAQWQGWVNRMVFGDGWAIDDIAGHELTHGITDHESNLIYANESGAINESFSDMWGEWIDQSNGRGDDSASVKWLIGEELQNGALRNMADPPQMSTWFGGAMPDRYSLIYQGTIDFGGVHHNSGVGNKLCYLLTDGDSFNGYSISAMGIDGVADLFYECQTSGLLTSAADYQDLATVVLQVANNLGLSASEIENIKQACQAVEIMHPEGHDVAVEVYVSQANLIHLPTQSMSGEIWASNLGEHSESGTLSVQLTDSSGDPLASANYPFNSLGAGQSSPRQPFSLNPGGYQGNASVRAQVTIAYDLDLSNNHAAVPVYFNDNLNPTDSFDGFERIEITSGQTKTITDRNGQQHSLQFIGVGDPQGTQITIVLDGEWFNPYVGDTILGLPWGVIQIGNRTNWTYDFYFWWPDNLYTFSTQYLTVPFGGAASFEVTRTSGSWATLTQHDMEFISGLLPGGWGSSVAYEDGKLVVQVQAAHGSGTINFNGWAHMYKPNGVGRYSDAFRWMRFQAVSSPPETLISSGPEGMISEHDVTFVWSGSDDTTPADQLQYAFRLEPLESAFSSFSDDTEKTYSNLEDGEYTFFVKARDLGGTEDPTPASRTFTVTSPPPYIPVNRLPLPGQEGLSATPTLVGSEFTHQDSNATFAKSRFQVRLDTGSYDGPQWDSGELSPGTINVQVTQQLAFNSKYWWRCRYQDSRGAWSPWSNETSFRTRIDWSLSDLNNNGRIDLGDLAILAQHWRRADCTANNTWCDGADINHSRAVDAADLYIMAEHWLEGTQPSGPTGMVWVHVDDPGVDADKDGTPDHEGFNGYMSKYEMTNAQYCEYLNAAKADGLLTVHNDKVYALSDTGHSQVYFDTHPASSESQVTYSAGTFSVRSRDGYDMSNHPVVMVSWYGATAFCDYYGYRLPTEWEWQAVADYDGNYTYGCGTTIDQSKANYYDSGYANPLDLSTWPYTSPVGYYPAYGYGMCDMAGNVWEWTSSIYDPQHTWRVHRGGGWFHDDLNSRVAYRNNTRPDTLVSYIGFRVVQNAQ